VYLVQDTGRELARVGRLGEETVPPAGLLWVASRDGCNIEPAAAGMELQPTSRGPDLAAFERWRLA
jgi:hypothetical protein